MEILKRINAKVEEELKSVEKKGRREQIALVKLKKREHQREVMKRDIMEKDMKARSEQKMI